MTRRPARMLSAALGITLSLLATASWWSLVPAPAAGAQPRTCDSFPSQAAAQAAYRADPLSLGNLDRDTNGIACEDNPPPFDRTPVRPDAARAALAGTSAGAAQPAPPAAPAGPRTGTGFPSEAAAPLGGMAATLVLAMLALAAGVLAARRHAR